MTTEEPVGRGKVVRAGGGVVRRCRPDGRFEYAIIHRPRYDDWSLPKGKAGPGESDERAALREVEEETGVAARLGPELASTAYTDRNGRPKVVRYWLMEPTGDGHPFVPNHEVDALRWCTADEAAKLLTQEHDRKLVEDAEARP